MKEETAKKAAKWWGDQLRGSSKLDNGDNSLTGVNTFLLAAMLQEKEKQKQSTELVDAFEEELTKALLKDNPSWGFGVDYHPDAILSDAADAAKLPLGMTTLPWKTTMWIQDDKVKVRCGYGAEIIEL